MIGRDFPEPYFFRAIEPPTGTSGIRRYYSARSGIAVKLVRAMAMKLAPGNGDSDERSQTLISKRAQLRDPRRQVGFRAFDTLQVNDPELTKILI
jgi:hypothetical protein